MSKEKSEIIEDLFDVMNEVPAIFDNTDFEFHSFDSATMQLFVNIEGDWSEKIRAVAEEMMRHKYPKLNICAVIDRRYNTNIIPD